MPTPVILFFLRQTLKTLEEEALVNVLMIT